MFSKSRLVAICLFLLVIPSPGLHAADLDIDPRLLRPLPVHNMYPAMLQSFDPIPSSALQPYDDEYHIALLQHYTSIFIFDELPDGRLLADMEVYTLELQLDKAVSDNLELGFTVPMHYAWGGFMDGFLRDYHDALGLPNSGRELRPDNEYAWSFTGLNGDDIWQDSSGWELGNMVMSLRRQVSSSEQAALDLLAALQLPTGSTSRGWSSGNLDVAAGLVYSWKNDSWFGHLEGWLMQPLNIEETAVDYRGYARGVASLGWLWREKLSLLAQVHAGTSAFETGLTQLDDPPVQIAMGLNWKLTQGTMINFSFVENISQQTAPDFSVTVGLYFD